MSVQLRWLISWKTRSVREHFKKFRRSASLAIPTTQFSNLDKKFWKIMWSVAISGPPNVVPVICICGGLTIKEAELLPDVEVEVFMKELAVDTAKESSSPPSSIWYSISWVALYFQYICFWCVRQFQLNNTYFHFMNILQTILAEGSINLWGHSIPMAQLSLPLSRSK